MLEKDCELKGVVGWKSQRTFQRATRWTSLSSTSQKRDRFSIRSRGVPTHPGQTYHLPLFPRPPSSILISNPVPLELWTETGVPWMKRRITLIIWKECPFGNKFAGEWFTQLFLLRVWLLRGSQSDICECCNTTASVCGTKGMVSYEASFWKMNQPSHDAPYLYHLLSPP